MDVAYWDGVAKGFDDQIFDVLLHDRAGVVKDAVRKVAAPGCRIADFGCGNGRQLEFLASVAGDVQAYDLSPELVAMAVERTAHLPHVACHREDLCRPSRALGPVDIAVCVNAVMMPSRPLRDAFMRTLVASLREDGTLVLVVPSVESILLEGHRLVDWYRSMGSSLRKARALTDASSWMSVSGVLDGVFRLDGVRTKHYLRDELALLLGDAGFTVESIDKVEYAWSSMYDDPPEWLASPYPWDWMAVARRNGKAA